MMSGSADECVSTCREATGWRSQFAHPRGWRGWIVGQLLATKNRERSLWVLPLLDLQPHHHVLEIGFGPGVDIRRAAERVPNGFVAGIDHSETMVRQASARNAAAIRAGRVELRRGTASELPYAPESFDVVFGINVAQFWDSQVQVAGEIRRVLKTGGHVALIVQPRNKGANEGTADEVGAMLMHTLTAAGFRDVRLERKRMRPVSTVCAIGRK